MGGEFIILTGYSEFEFAKSAVSLGVRAYLLKPIEEDELLQNIIAIKAELDDKKDMNNYYSLSELKARKDVLRNLLVYTEDKEELHKDIKLYGMDYQYQSFCAVIISKEEEYIDENLAMNYEKLEVLLKDLDYIDKIMLDNKLVLIGKGSTYRSLFEKLQRNNDRIKRRYGDRLFIAIGHDVAHLEDIHFSYETAKLLSEYKFLFKSQSIICIDIFQDGIDDIDVSARQLCQLIEIGDLEEIETTLLNVKDYYKANLMKETEIKVLIIQKMLLIHNRLEQKYKEKKSVFPDFKMLVEDIKKSDNLEDLMDKITVFSTQLAEEIGVSSDHVIKRIVVYMNRNYDQDLKLENIGKMFNYNSAYLGKIFKKEIGEGFNDVLNSIRIDNAKRLLNDTDLKVYQVSEAVGYNNIDYFYLKFKKYVGVSPKEFKNENQIT